MLEKSVIVYNFIYVKNLDLSREFYEKKLGFRVLEEYVNSVKYEAGDVIVGLSKAEDYGIDLKGSLDDSSLMVFHVNDIDKTRSELENRGITFSEATYKCNIGKFLTLYDPDGHGLCMYEPSFEAMRESSGGKIRKILDKNATFASLPLVKRESVDGSILDNRKMLYIFLFVRDAEEAINFYNKKVGLRILEEDKITGIVKYDSGGIILATCPIESNFISKTKINNWQHPKTIAPVFKVSDVQSIFQAFSTNKVYFTNKPFKSEIGKTASFRDPNGHVFYLYEPSKKALAWPSGLKIKCIVREYL